MLKTPNFTKKKHAIIKIPKNVVLKKNNNILIVNGPLNMKYFYMSNFTININIEKKFITVYFNNSNTKNEQELQKKEFVFFTKFLKNISKLYKKNLTIKGIGYNSSILNLKNNTILVLKLGFSHLIYIKIPKNLKVSCISKNKIQIIGAAKEKVSQFARLIKSYKKPEPYKGKGILYENEKINIKVGKKL